METLDQPFYNDIETITKDNMFYRRVIYTIPGRFQLVLMAIPPGGDIPKETHSDVVQFIRVEDGHGEAKIGSDTILLKDGSAIVIPPGVEHYVYNVHPDKYLKLYSIYTPPEHPSDRIQVCQSSQT